MARSRHKHVLHSRRRRLIRLGAPLAAVLAAAAPAAAAVWPAEPPVPPMSVAKPVKIRTSAVPVQMSPLSGATTEVRLQGKPPRAVDHKYATTRLDVRVRPSESAPAVKKLHWAQKVSVTGATKGRWTEVLIGPNPRWVDGAYLSNRDPNAAQQTTSSHLSPTASATTPAPTSSPPSTASANAMAGATPQGLSSTPCASGSTVESGLVQNAIAVHRAVCARFPQVTTYEGVRGSDGGDHATGHALDIMVASSSTGNQIAAWVRAHASTLGVNYVIWAQHIWSVQRSSEGWRLIADRGSTTANYYDHVHVSVD